MKYGTFFSLIALIPVVLSNTSSKASKPYKVVCYLGSWANYRNGDGKFVIEDIDPNLCTHLIYGFTKLSHDNRIAVYDPYLDLKENWGLGAFQRFNNLKHKNPTLKTLIAIGGWNEGSTKYSQMASNPSSRKRFVNSCIDFLNKHGFDGLDLDWEYPGSRGGKAEDKKNFVSLIKELKEAFQPHGFLLTAAVSAGKNTIDSAYDIPALGKYLDFINLMTYDFHGGWDKTTGHNAPLYSRKNEPEQNKILNVDYAVNYWLSNGCPADKLILGMPLYGRGFSLQDSSKHGLDEPVNGKGMAGEYTREPGMLGYNEICKMLKQEKGWTVVFESSIEAPYAYKDKQWIGYDNEKSIYLKVQYLQKKKLAGAMVWSIETDDFRGQCHGNRYPLLRAINEGLNRKLSDDTTKPVQENSITPEVEKKTSDTPILRTTSAPNLTTNNDVEHLLPCPYSGYFKHPRDCKLFYFCQPKSAGNKEDLFYMFRCSEGTVFSQSLRVCAFPNSVPGCS